MSLSSIDMEAVPSEPFWFAKIYKLNDSLAWDDCGTVHVVCNPVSTYEDDLNMNKQPFVPIRFMSSDPPHEQLTEFTISAGDVLKRENATFINWKPASSSDQYAISFMLPAGRSHIWESLCRYFDADPSREEICGESLLDVVDEHSMAVDGDSFPHHNSSNYYSGHDMDSKIADSNWDSAAGDALISPSSMSLLDKEANGSSPSHFAPLSLPEPVVSNLHQIRDSIVSFSLMEQNRVSLISFLLQDSDHFLNALLLETFPEVERQNNRELIEVVCVIVHKILQLNDPDLIEHLTRGTLFESLLGVFEYHLDGVQRPYRQQYRERIRFREAVPLSDPNLVEAIQHLFRLNFLKDAIVPRNYHDATVTMLSSLSTFAMSRVMDAVTMSPRILNEIASILLDSRANYPSSSVSYRTSLSSRELLGHFEKGDKSSDSSTPENSYNEEKASSSLSSSMMEETSHSEKSMMDVDSVDVAVGIRGIDSTATYASTSESIPDVALQSSEIGSSSLDDDELPCLKRRRAIFFLQEFLLLTEGKTSMQRMYLFERIRQDLAHPVLLVLPVLKDRLAPVDELLAALEIIGSFAQFDVGGFRAFVRQSDTSSSSTSIKGRSSRVSESSKKEWEGVSLFKDYIHNALHPSRSSYPSRTDTDSQTYSTVLNRSVKIGTASVGLKHPMLPEQVWTNLTSMSLEEATRSPPDDGMSIRLWEKVTFSDSDNIATVLAKTQHNLLLRHAGEHGLWTYSLVEKYINVVPPVSPSRGPGSETEVDSNGSKLDSITNGDKKSANGRRPTSLSDSDEDDVHWSCSTHTSNHGSVREAPTAVDEDIGLAHKCPESGDLPLFLSLLVWRAVDDPDASVQTACFSILKTTLDVDFLSIFPGPTRSYSEKLMMRLVTPWLMEPLCSPLLIENRLPPAKDALKLFSLLSSTPSAGPVESKTDIYTQMDRLVAGASSDATALQSSVNKSMIISALVPSFTSPSANGPSAVPASTSTSNFPLHYRSSIRLIGSESQSSKFSKSQIFDFLSCLILSYTDEMRSLCISNGISAGAARVLQYNEKSLVLVAAKFLKLLICIPDPMLMVDMASSRVISAVVAAFIRNGNRGDLLSSVLESFLELVLLVEGAWQLRQQLLPLLPLLERTIQWTPVSTFSNTGTGNKLAGSRKVGAHHPHAALLLPFQLREGVGRVISLEQLHRHFGPPFSSVFSGASIGFGLGMGHDFSGFGSDEDDELDIDMDTDPAGGDEFGNNRFHSSNEDILEDEVDEDVDFKIGDLPGSLNSADQKSSDSDQFDPPTTISTTQNQFVPMRTHLSDLDDEDDFPFLQTQKNKNKSLLPVSSTSSGTNVSAKGRPGISVSISMSLSKNTAKNDSNLEKEQNEETIISTATSSTSFSGSSSSSDPLVESGSQSNPFSIVFDTGNAPESSDNQDGNDAYGSFFDTSTSVVGIIATPSSSVGMATSAESVEVFASSSSSAGSNSTIVPLTSESDILGDTLPLSDSEDADILVVEEREREKRRESPRSKRLHNDGQKSGNAGSINNNNGGVIVGSSASRVSSRQTPSNISPSLTSGSNIQSFQSISLSVTDSDNIVLATSDEQSEIRSANVESLESASKGTFSVLKSSDIPGTASALAAVNEMDMESDNDRNLGSNPYPSSQNSTDSFPADFLDFGYTDQDSNSNSNFNSNGQSSVDGTDPLYSTSVSLSNTSSQSISNNVSRDSTSNRSGFSNVNSSNPSGTTVGNGNILSNGNTEQGSNQRDFQSQEFSSPTRSPKSASSSPPSSPCDNGRFFNTSRKAVVPYSSPGRRGATGFLDSSASLGERMTPSAFFNADVDNNGASSDSGEKRPRSNSGSLNVARIDIGIEDTSSRRMNFEPNTGDDDLLKSPAKVRNASGGGVHDN